MRRRQTSGINQLVGVIKPTGCSSHDVVNRMRRICSERRVGHAGTLDPLASGVMVVGVGQATRLLGLVTCDEKRYLARIAFGRETDTDDEEGQTTERADAPDCVDDLRFACASMGVLLSMTSQVPPAYSAISVGGRRAYAVARSGGQVELDPRPIRVTDAQVVSVGRTPQGEPFWDVSLTVSKGTYVRALARDLGRALGSAAHLNQLRRTASGSVGLDACHELDELQAIIDRDGALPALDPLAVLGIPGVRITESQADLVARGMPVTVPAGAETGESDNGVALVYHGQLRALARVDGGLLRPKAVFADGIDGVSEL